jgi:nucleoside-diphosphate-sugar epimerase
MEIFVAGATGLLGRGVVRRLAAAGHTVRGLSRTTRNEGVIHELGGRPVAGDLFDVRSLVAAVGGAEAVLHLATKIPLRIRPSLADFAENDRIRTQGTVNLLEAARRAGARLYIQQSIAFLAATAERRRLADDDPCVLPAPPGTPAYAASKMEQLVRRAADAGMGATILRGGLFYHAESAQTRQLIDAVAKRRLPIFGRGDNVVSTIHADDMAEAVVAALARPAPGETFFVVDDSPLRFADFVNTVARLVGAPPARHLPEFLARPVLGPVMGILPKISFDCPNAKLKAATGWAPVYADLETGMREVLARLGR